MVFPDWETLPYDHFSPHQDIISARLATLNTLKKEQHSVLIVPVSTLDAAHRAGLVYIRLDHQL